MSSITHTDALDYSCYYDETSDQYHIPKEELDEFVEIFRIIQKQKNQLEEGREEAKKHIEGEYARQLEAVNKQTEKITQSLITNDKLYKQLEKEKDRYFGYLKDKDLECETQRELYEEEYKKLEGLQSDLSRLDDFMDGLTGVCDYDDLVVYMNARFDEIHRLESERDAFEEQLHKSLEGQVKDTEEIEKLKEEIEELKTSLQTTTSYHTDKYELLKDEIQELKEKYEGELVSQEEFCKD